MHSQLERDTLHINDRTKSRKILKEVDFKHTSEIIINAGQDQFHATNSMSYNIINLKQSFLIYAEE